MTKTSVQIRRQLDAEVKRLRAEAEVLNKAANDLRPPQKKRRRQKPTA